MDKMDCWWHGIPENCADLLLFLGLSRTVVAVSVKYRLQQRRQYGIGNGEY